MLQTQILQELRGHQGTISALAYCANGRMLASAGSDDLTVRLWDVATGRERAVLTSGWSTTHRHNSTDSSGPKAVIRSLQVDPHDQRIYAGARGTMAIEPDMVVVWSDPPSWEPRILGHLRGCVVSLSPDGRTLVSGVGAWDLQSEIEVGRLDGSSPPQAFSPDGTWFASGVMDPWGRAASRLALRRTTDWSIRRLLEHWRGLNSVAFSSDGRYLATGAHDGIVTVWDLEDVAAPIAFSVGDACVTVAFAPNTPTLAVGTRESLSFWDVLTITERGWIDQPSPVKALAFTPDGSRIASGGKDRIIRVWEVPAPGDWW